MLARRIATALALTITSSPAWAFAPNGADHGGLELADGAEVREARTLSTREPAAQQAAWSRLALDREQLWRASWDADTGVPARLMGRGIAVPGSIARSDVAEAAAKKFLSEHIALLAPGSVVGDFALAANRLDDGMRTVAFVQQHRGMDVRGGQVSFRFKKDRLFVVGSEAVPNVRVPPYGASRVAADRARALAEAWVAEGAPRELSAGAVSEPFVLPVVLANGESYQRRVIEVTVEAHGPRGRWAVALDAESGARVARRQTLMFLTGSVTMNTPDRRPGAARRDRPAPLLRLTVDGRAVETDAAGSFTVTASQSASVTTSVVGRLVRVVNGSGAGAAITARVQDGGTLAWNAANTEQIDSQLITYVSSHVVKDYTRTFAPNLRYNDAQLEANVNLDDVCNAYSDGQTINFFNSGSGCENTGRLPDVVYHEYGHAIHLNSIIRGAGSFDTALSEGASDFLAASITGDQGMGRGFFFDNRALRQVDPSNREAVWPADIDQDPHITGLIFAGTMWDLRKVFIDKYGEAAGVTLANRLWYATLQRAADLPTTYAEVLAADDDDGDLSNGTPNLCDISAAFVAHGLASREQVSPQLSDPSRRDFEVSVNISGESLCPGSELTGAELIWDVRGVQGTGGRIPLGNGGGTRFTASIPQQPSGTVVRYRIEGTLASGERTSLPDNAADPMYEFYVGPLVQLYCTDFETDPFTEGWTHALLAGRAREGADDWMWGTPNGTEGSGDPERAISGRNVIGNDLGGGNFNGAYQPGITNEVVSPVIDTQGFTTVRLQYWRWLNVEDGAYDKAEVLADDTILWSNQALGDGMDPGVNHVDKEWRFHDVDVSGQADDGQVRVRYRLTTDRGLELGGWTIDDFCLYGVDTMAAPVCGNGVLETGEICDDGNTADGDGCQSSCTPTPAMAICGDGTTDPGEACDDGNDDDTDGCTRLCQPSAAAACGNNVSDPGEQCDDGNLVAGDGCSATCATETPVPLEPGVIGTEDPSCGCTASSPATALPSVVLMVIGLALIRRRRR